MHPRAVTSAQEVVDGSSTVFRQYALNYANPAESARLLTGIDLQEGIEYMLEMEKVRSNPCPIQSGVSTERCPGSWREVVRILCTLVASEHPLDSDFAQRAVFAHTLEPKRSIPLGGSHHSLPPRGNQAPGGHATASARPHEHIGTRSRVVLIVPDSVVCPLCRSALEACEPYRPCLVEHRNSSGLEFWYESLLGKGTAPASRLSVLRAVASVAVQGMSRLACLRQPLAVHVPFN